MKKEFIDYINAHREDTLAITTILGTEGSTPRKVGTTMLVYPEGRIVGTIGGGRAENEIRLTAMEVLKNKEACRRITVTLNDDVAMKEGMVCGGVMDVWIETLNNG